MKCTKAIGNAIAHGAASAAIGAIAGASGAKVLSAAGYAGYSVLEATRAGAAGNAAIGGFLGFFSSQSDKDDDAATDLKKLLGKLTINAGLSTLGGMLGRTMLSSITEMPLDKMAAALATGSGLVAGGGFVVAGVLLGCCCLYVAVSSEAREENRSLLSPV